MSDEPKNEPASEAESTSPPPAPPPEPEKPLKVESVIGSAVLRDVDAMIREGEEKSAED